MDLLLVSYVKKNLRLNQTLCYLLNYFSFYFGSVTYFEFIIMFGVLQGFKFILLCMNSHLSQYHLLKRLSFPVEWS